jgi:hypothetical protein
MKIYVGQTALRMNFSCSADITGYTTTVISVWKPNGSTATWTATVSDVSTGAIYYDVATTTILNVGGPWRMQPKIIFSDDTVGYGETANQMIHNLGE